MPEHIKMEFSEITPDLYVGTNECCQMHYKLELIDRGITHNVSMEAERIDGAFGVDTFLWLPTSDHTAPGAVELAIGCSYIDRVIKEGGKVYVHCKNGHGRGPTMAAAWLMWNGMSFDDALALVRARRMEAHLEPSQLEALKQFAHRPK